MPFFSSDAERLIRVWGTIVRMSAGQVAIAGISEHASIGDEVLISSATGHVNGEILSLSPAECVALLQGMSSSVRIGDIAELLPPAKVYPGEHWLGQIVNFRGEPVATVEPGNRLPGSARPLQTPAPPAHLRRRLGPRLNTGLMVTDTLLPLCRGQRIGLFAGSGIGKSTLLGALAESVSADRVVIALIGERSREVNEFVYGALSAEALGRSVVVTATSSEPPGAKKRAAYVAMAAAEHFRDQGHQVLLLFDSLTRFAEAHREIALAAGETPALHAFPPSTVRVVAELVERAGTGHANQGDITAVFSVLVAGSDHDEPLADMVRGLLDGHIVLDRAIAERGRFPAIDVLRSVSRSLPWAATDEENALLGAFRRLIATHHEIAPMVRAGLYERGRDVDGDRALDLFHALDGFVGMPNKGTVNDAFAHLKGLMGCG